jgi:hypothetical protein
MPRRQNSNDTQKIRIQYYQSFHSLAGKAQDDRAQPGLRKLESDRRTTGHGSYARRGCEGAALVAYSGVGFSRIVEWIWLSV